MEFNYDYYVHEVGLDPKTGFGYYERKDAADQRILIKSIEELDAQVKAWNEAEWNTKKKTYTYTQVTRSSTR